MEAKTVFKNPTVLVAFCLAWFQTPTQDPINPRAIITTNSRQIHLISDKVSDGTPKRVCDPITYDRLIVAGGGDPSYGPRPFGEYVVVAKFVHRPIIDGVEVVILDGFLQHRSDPRRSAKIEFRTDRLAEEAQLDDIKNANAGQDQILAHVEDMAVMNKLIRRIQKGLPIWIHPVFPDE